MWRSHRITTKNFYPRPPRGGRPASGLRDGEIFHFYPRPPRGGRHSNWVRFLTKRIISIHALREEGDQFFFDRARAALQFLSTPSARRATIQKSEVSAVEKISIHALREEGDISKKSRYKTRKANFYPRPPRGGRRVRCPSLSGKEIFLSTPSARRATH